MNAFPHRGAVLLRASPRRSPCTGSYSHYLSSRETRIFVSAPDAPQAEPTPAHLTDSLATVINVPSDEVKKRNDEALARVLSDFATAKATGQLAEAEAEDEDEIEGEEGEDWVWWRAEDQTFTSQIQPSSSSSISSTVQASRPPPAPGTARPSSALPPSESPPASLPAGASLLKPRTTEARGPKGAEAGGPAASSVVNGPPFPRKRPSSSFASRRAAAQPAAPSPLTRPFPADTDSRAD